MNNLTSKRKTNSQETGERHLIVLSQMRAKVLGSGRIAITQKFIWGMDIFAETWPGQITAVIEPSDQQESEMGRIEVDPSELSFGIQILPFDDNRLAEQIGTAEAVLAGLGHKTLHIIDWCNRYQIPCIYVTEYSLATRVQGLEATVSNPLLRFRRKFWTRRLEKKYTRAITASAGVQCTGTPTYFAYRDINPSPLLFFSSRISSEQIVVPSEICKRLDELKNSGKLRLLFSGRLTRMKGADQLPAVARALREMNVDFKMYICGCGDAEGAIRTDIDKHSLGKYVDLTGELDYERELLPLAKRQCDLFVCPHPQGDPSATYLESMGCGLPIVGYANEALTGMIELSKAGWVTPLNDPIKLAERIAEIADHPESIEVPTNKAIEFAKQHSFDRVFRNRIKHVLEICEAWRNNATR